MCKEQNPNTTSPAHLGTDASKYIEVHDQGLQNRAMYKQVLLCVNDCSDDRKLQSSKCSALGIFYLEWDTT